MNAASKGIALITGASSGIGLVTAQALAKAGYRVFGTSRKVVPSPAGITMLVCDVTDEASVKSLVDEVVRQAGRIDLVVNNAGVGLLGAAEESSISQAQRLFDVNVFGVARVVNAVLPIMRAQKGGRIINMSSILGLIPPVAVQRLLRVYQTRDRGLHRIAGPRSARLRYSRGVGATRRDAHRL